MPKIPDHDYNVSELDEKKLFSVVYQYEIDGVWFADTWNVTEQYMSQALEKVDAFCDGNLESGNWSAYEITNINLIRRGV